MKIYCSLRDIICRSATALDMEMASSDTAAVAAAGGSSEHGLSACESRAMSLFEPAPEAAGYGGDWALTSQFEYGSDDNILNLYSAHNCNNTSSIGSGDGDIDMGCMEQGGAGHVGVSIGSEVDIGNFLGSEMDLGCRGSGVWNGDESDVGGLEMGDGSCNSETQSTAGDKISAERSCWPVVNQNPGASQEDVNVWGQSVPQNTPDDRANSCRLEGHGIEQGAWNGAAEALGVARGTTRRVCSLCGGVGHNRRTCVKTAAHVVSVGGAGNKGSHGGPCEGFSFVYSGAKVQILSSDGEWGDGGHIACFDPERKLFNIQLPDGSIFASALPNANIRVLSNLFPWNGTMPNTTKTHTFGDKEAVLPIGRGGRGGIEVKRRGKVPVKAVDSQMVNSCAHVGGADEITPPFNYAQACLMSPSHTRFSHHIICLDGQHQPNLFTPFISFRNLNV